MAHRSEEHTSELQSQSNLVCRLLLETKNRHHRPACFGRGWSRGSRGAASPSSGYLDRAVRDRRASRPPEMLRPVVARLGVAGASAPHIRAPPSRPPGSPITTHPSPCLGSGGTRRPLTPAYPSAAIRARSARNPRASRPIERLLFFFK